ncbi:LacI family DNA-binding transcriptional regulator [Roseomonas nepalensis]|uniref:LacI family DNA-binding transcriptional regulator n=1 Tax=Muricoccus nepalensis TaxID=1854500 RepID=A0A502GBB5_9PROT|nr:LacI family DNA-binding transcriptional regulator [Roseomonas nepalensis]TPG58630.1 LacI family DNA-binding transcriptional regulator [Roseomonas nepalensis]
MAEAGEGKGDSGARPRATLASVASRVGVSLNTVSRALRAPQTVRPELRKRIEAALNEADYVPNRLAGGLVRTRSNVVGVVVTSLFYSEFAAVVDALQTGLADHGLQVMLGNSRYDQDQELQIVRDFLSWRPAAMAIIGLDHHPRAAELLRASGTPVVEMWDAGGAFIDSVVGMDHVAIGRAQGGHLIARGYRRLAFLGSLRAEDARARKRAEGFMAAGAQVGRPVLHTLPEPGDPRLGERLLHELLDRHPDIDGVACNSDAVAFGVLRALGSRARRVPNDCGVVGFGDSEASAYMAPPLTTIRPSREAIGRLTAETILARIAGGAPRQLAVGWDLIERASTGAADRLL